MSRPAGTRKTFKESEFGDFQTPALLAKEACTLLAASGIKPRSVVEPTCGLGVFLFQALDAFPRIECGIGLDVSPIYVKAVQAKMRERADTCRITVLEADFFQANWTQLISDLPEPILVIGNPPWVTSAQIGVLHGSNLPEKNNFQNHAGLDAKMGKSNFDISEWMLVQAINWLHGRNGCMAMLCKTAVARKLLNHVWKSNISVERSAIYKINALKQFGAMVDACFFVCHFKPGARNYDSSVYTSLEASEPLAIIGYRDNQLVAKVALYEKWKHLQCKDQQHYKWRSGIKHDCSKIMEFTREGNGYRNGLGQLVDLEDEFLYPMLKTSEVAKCNVLPTRYMLVPQTFIGEGTDKIKEIAPKIWAYLQVHSKLLQARRSSIYKNRPPFSIFGVGEYSFATWKIAISGFYKSLNFRIVGPHNGRPTILDDASYFIPCNSEAEADLLLQLLSSTPAQAFLESFIFWDAKRPITADLLRRLDLISLAQTLSLGPDLQQHILSNNQASKQRKRCLSVQLGMDVQLTLEIATEVPGAASDEVVNIITENGHNLTFETLCSEE